METRGHGRLPETLLIVYPFSEELRELTDELQRRGLSAVATGAGEKATRLLAGWEPQAAVVSSQVKGWRALLGFLHNRDIPIVFRGEPGHVQVPEVATCVDVAILATAEPAEIAYAIEIVMGVAPPVSTPPVLVAGDLTINIPSRVVTIGGDVVDLPPKEFEILVELARAPGQPVTSGELIRRVWPHDSYATADDVHWHVWRLRKLIGDHDRERPRVASRRGFGYQLEPRPDVDQRLAKPR